MVFADAAGFSHVSRVSDVMHLRVRRDLAILVLRFRRPPETDVVVVVVVVPQGAGPRAIIAAARDCMSRGCILSILPHLLSLSSSLVFSWRSRDIKSIRETQFVGLGMRSAKQRCRKDNKETIL